MQRIPSRIAMLALLFTTGICAAATSPEHLEQVVRRGMSDWQVPGMALAVMEDGEIVLSRGFGTTRADGGDPVSDHTPFANASTTKAMVAAGILLLVDEGRVDLDAPVIDYLPELHFGDPVLTPQLTLRDLLTHRTGLPSTDFWTFNQGMPLADQLPRLREVAPAAAPRARHIYQNTMYELAGLVIERVGGQPWQDFLRDRLWQPIGMDETWGMRGRIPAGRAHAWPHDEVDGRVREIAFSLRPEVADAAGSVWSTVSDMMRWARFLLDGGVTADGRRLLSEAAIAEMFRPQHLIAAEDFYPTVELTHPHWTSYGLGWFQQDFQGRKIDFHTGSLNGLVAIFGLDRERGRAVMVMANRDHAELRHALLWEVMDERPPNRRPDWNAEVLAIYQARAAEREAAWAALQAGRIADSPPSLPLDAYAGRYDSPRNGPLEVSVDGVALRLQTLARSYRLTPWHADTFLVMHEDWNRGFFARFSLTPAGAIDGVEFFGERFGRQDAD